MHMDFSSSIPDPARPGCGSGNKLIIICSVICLLIPVPTPSLRQFITHIALHKPLGPGSLSPLSSMSTFRPKGGLSYSSSSRLTNRVGDGRPQYDYRCCVSCADRKLHLHCDSLFNLVVSTIISIYLEFVCPHFLQHNRAGKPKFIHRYLVL